MNSIMQRFALIVAGGLGRRMGAGIPKQFLDLAGRPVLMHSIEKFWLFDKTIRIILVIPKDHFEFWQDLQKAHSFIIPHIIVSGGLTRFHSVKNGLKEVGDDGVVAIHDGVRPLVSSDTLKRCFETAENFGNAVPVTDFSESVRIVNEQGSMPIDRSLLRIVQTPQVFSVKLIRNAYLREYSSEFTDDASLLEKTGVRIHLVEGNRENIKITDPGDLELATTLFHTFKDR